MANVQKCRYCGAETIGSDVCAKCLDNPMRQDFFTRVKTYKMPKRYPRYEAFCDYTTEEHTPDGDKTVGHGFESARVAIWLAREEHFKTDLKTDFLLYGDSETGVWELHGEQKLREIVTTILGDYDKKYYFTNILHTLKGLTTEEIKFSKKVSLENGLFDLENKELTPHTLEEMPRFKFPLTYDPEAKDLDDWLAYLNQDAEPEDIPVLQEWMGYCLYPDYPIHAALWIHGTGRNGKGVYDRTIQGLIGSDNCVHTNLSNINSRFGLKDFYGKIYYSNSEPPTNKPFRTEVFKRLCGGDPIDAEFKGKNDLVRFVNLAKLTIIGNQFPKIINPTVAFKDRMIFVKFTRFIEKKDRVPNLEKIWLEDPKKRSALFNWALEGLHRLLANSRFTETKTQEQTELEFQRVADTPGAFISEMGIIDKNLVTTRSQAREAYEEYCDDNGLDLASKSEFTKAMQQLAPKVKDGKIRVEGKQERAWIGFGVKEVVQMVQMVHHFHTGNKNESFLIERENSVPSVPSVPKVELCSEVCRNFYKKEGCTHKNPESLTDKAVKPLKCPGYYPIDVSEAS